MPKISEESRLKLSSASVIVFFKNKPDQSLFEEEHWIGQRQAFVNVSNIDDSKMSAISSLSMKSAKTRSIKIKEIGLPFLT